MGKFTNINRLSKKEQEELFIHFAQSLNAIHNSIEAANFIKDLLSESEALMLARRLQVAELLMQGLTYQQIRKISKISFSTIARVQTWLKLYGDGYRTIIQRTQKAPAAKFEGVMGWRQLKQKYPMYFWPELLLREIAKSASAREKKRLLKVVEELRGKTKLAKQLVALLK